MVYTKIYPEKNSINIPIVYKILGKEDSDEFYDQIEIMLCGKLHSGFGRNLDALVDVLTGGFGKLNSHLQHRDKVVIQIIKSKILPNKIKNIIINIIQKNLEDGTGRYLEIILQ